MYVRYLVRFAVAAAIAVACAPPAPTERDGEGSLLPPRTDESLPPPASTSKSSSSSSSSSGGSSGGTSNDKKSGDGGATADAGTMDASPDGSADGGGALGFGAECQTGAQCAGGICQEFDDVLRCTQACNDDDECPSNECDDDVCEVE